MCCHMTKLVVKKLHLCSGQQWLNQFVVFNGNIKGLQEI